MKTENYPERIYMSIYRYGSEIRACHEYPRIDSHIGYDNVPYLRFDLVHKWQPIPTDREGFGLYDEVFQKASVIGYRDGTIFGKFDFDDDLASDIERHPNRYGWMELPKFNPNNK